MTVDTANPDNDLVVFFNFAVQASSGQRPAGVLARLTSDTMLEAACRINRADVSEPRAKADLTDLGRELSDRAYDPVKMRTLGIPPYQVGYHQPTRRKKDSYWVVAEINFVIVKQPRRARRPRPARPLVSAVRPALSPVNREEVITRILRDLELLR